MSLRNMNLVRGSDLELLLRGAATDDENFRLPMNDVYQGEYMVRKQKPKITSSHYSMTRQRQNSPKKPHMDVIRDGKLGLLRTTYLDPHCPRF